MEGYVRARRADKLPGFADTRPLLVLQTGVYTCERWEHETNITAEKRDRPVFCQQSTNRQKERQTDRPTD